MIQTARLTLLPLTLDQLRLHVADNAQLEASLGLRKGHREVAEPLLSIIVHFTVPRLKDPAFDPLYHTIWIAIDRQKRLIVADAKFKGEPDETGTVEIGYGTYPAFERQGYMSEMVGGLVRWAGQQPGVGRVVADTNAENVASQKVLEKSGFRLFDRVEEMLWWEYQFAEHVSQLITDANGYLTPYGVIRADEQTVEINFATNDHRVGLWQQYTSFMASVKQSNVPVIQIWMDGSFISQKSLPNDIDLVLYVPDTFAHGRFSLLTNLSKPFPKLHVMWIGLAQGATGLNEALNELVKFRYYDLFSTDKDDLPKGFIELSG